MSNKTSVYTLHEILALTDEELTSNWSRLGSLIKNYEQIPWKDAKKLAIQLFKDGKEMDYVEKVRLDLKTSTSDSEKEEKTTSKPIQKKKAKVVPLIKSKRDRFSLNYRRLLKLAPDLVERLEKGEEVYGKSQERGYEDFSMELTHKSKRGYFLALSQYYKQNGDLVPDPDMVIRLDAKQETIEALSFQDYRIYAEVYDDIYTPKMVNPKEKKSQNSFLEVWLRNLYKQGHRIVWKHAEGVDTPVKVKKNEIIPSISFLPKELRESLQQGVDKTVLDEVMQTYIKHKDGKDDLNPLSLYFVAKRINESPVGIKVNYPSELEMREYFESLKPKGSDKVVLELKKEVSKDAKLNTKVYSENYTKLLKLAPELVEKLSKNGDNLQGRSEKEELLYDFVLKVENQSDGTFNLMIVESGYIGKELEEHSAMEVHFDPKAKEVHALLTYKSDGEIEKVFSNVISLDGFDEKQGQKQNEFLTKWLDSLIEKGHVIDDWNDSSNKSKPKKTDQSKDIARLKKVGQNQLLKMNYQKLLRLIPDLFKLEVKNPVKLNSNRESVTIDVTALGKKGKFTSEFELFERETPFIRWGIIVQKTGKKVNVDALTDVDSKKKEKDGLEMNSLFSKWLDKKLMLGYDIIEESYKKVLEKYPIVIEWSEGSHESNIGLNNLEELQEKLKGFGFTDKPNETYIKNKVWFKGYPNYIRIDVSKVDGDYNPLNNKLEDWLSASEPNFDWSEFRAEPLEKEPKELQKQANKIPDFEVGKVKLVEAHKKAGIKQKHIDWINKNQEGLTITPIKRMVNKTENFFSDATKKAKKPGFRISRTGKLYYETRSNRSDMTKSGL